MKMRKALTTGIDTYHLDVDPDNNNEGWSLWWWLTTHPYPRWQQIVDGIISDAHAKSAEHKYINSKWLALVSYILIQFHY